MPKVSNDLLARTREVWEKRAGRAISDEEAQEIIDNMVGFARILIDWHASDERARVELRLLEDGGTPNQAPPGNQDV